MEQQGVVHESPRNMWVSKFILRIISAIFDLVLIGVAASLASTWFSGPAAIVFFLPTACAAFVWNVAEGISILVRGGHRGIHPGACVGVDLILWLAFCACSTMYVLFGYLFVYDAIFGYTSTTGYYTLNRISVAFGYLEVIMHFALFVIACVETSKRNHPATVVLYQPPPGMMVAPGYHPQSMVFQPNQYNQHPHQSMVIPAAYQPPPQSYQDHMLYPQAMPNGPNRDPNKVEADSTPVSIPSPVYDGHTDRRT